MRPGIGGKVVIKFTTEQAVESKVLDAVALKFQLKRQMHVDSLNILTEGTIGAAVFVRYIFLCKCQRGNEPQVYKIGQLQVADQSEVEARLPVGLNALKGVGVDK